MKEKGHNYPYLGKKEIDGRIYVVLFSEENYGTVILSEIKDNPSLAFGAIGDYDEDSFEYLSPEEQVSIHN